MPNADDGSHEWSVDGTHPDDYGYYLWTRGSVPSSVSGAWSAI